MKRDSFIFYRSFFEATQYLQSKQKADLFNLICSYALDHKETETDNIVKGMFSLIKPQLEANYKRWENGKKGAEFGKLGGRPKTPKKPQTNPTLTPNVNVNANVNVNEVIHTSIKHLTISNINYNKLVKEYGEKKVKEIFEQIENYKGNKKYNSLYLTAKNWLKREATNDTDKKRVSDFTTERAFRVTL